MKKSRFSLALSSWFLPFALALTNGCSSDPVEPVEESPPEDTTNPWNGETYLLDIEAQDWAEPRGIGAEIDAFVPNFLLRVDGEERETFTVMMGTADASGVQDECNQTSVVDATARPPGVTIGPSEFPLHVRHVDEEIAIAVDGFIYDLKITNVLPRGRTMAQDGELIATMDFRELYPLFTLLIDPKPETVCAAVEMTYLSPCAPCPHDGEPFCLTVKANYLGATPYDGVIEPIDALDPSCTPVPEPEQ